MGTAGAVRIIGWSDDVTVHYSTSLLRLSLLSGDRISHFDMVGTSVSTSCQWTSASPCSAEADARHMDHVHPWYVYPIPTLLPKTG